MALELTSPAEALTEAATLFSGLIVGLPSLPDFPEPPEVDIADPGTLPADLTATVPAVALADLTEGVVSGSGVFDKMMQSIQTHIESQYNKNLISKSEVAAIYIAAIQAALPQSIQFLVANQQAFWQTKLIQIQAQNAYLERTRLQVEIASARLQAFRAQAEAYSAQVGALTAQTQYANGKLQLVATMQAINSNEVQEALTEANYFDAYLKTNSTLPSGAAPGGHAAKDFLLKDEQIDMLNRQQLLLDAQTNVQRAQTYDTNTDTTPVAGVIGTQKNLYTQQIASYVLDGKNKAVKVVADLWTSAKALDDAVTSPGPLSGNLMMGLNKYMNDAGLPNAMVSPDTPGSGAPSTDTDWNTPGDQ